MRQMVVTGANTNWKAMGEDDTVKSQEYIFTEAGHGDSSSASDFGTYSVTTRTTRTQSFTQHRAAF